jgi:ABC-type multidrug transport system ATPase subunit
VKIYLKACGKRYRRQWVFKELSGTLESPQAYAVLGRNGAGKSTLLRMLAGMQLPTVGKLRYEIGGKEVAREDLFRHISFCAPGIELVEELTLAEMLSFHFSYKSVLPGLTLGGIPEILGLESAVHKPLSDFSSGMKQRVKIGLALFADTPLVLLDEPCSNLDESGVGQYQAWIAQYRRDRLLIVGSNDPREYAFCEQEIVLTN